MIEKDDAIELKDHVLNAVKALSLGLTNIGGKCSEDEYHQIKRAIGLTIGELQVNILDLLNSIYPELDDLI